MSKIFKRTIIILLSILLISIFMIIYYHKPYVKKFPKIKITVYSFRHKSNYKIEYLIITEKDGCTIIEIIRGSGQNNVEIIKGAKAQKFLKNIGLN